MSEVEANTRLVKLHLQWPQRRKFLGTDEEAFEFFKYLFLNFHGNRDVVGFESVDQIEAFLKKNQRLLTARPSVKKPRSSNARTEPRIANDAAVEVRLARLEGGSQDEQPGANGKTLDVGLHGLCVSLDCELPEPDFRVQGANQVTVTITTTAGDQYHLDAETKWHRHSDGKQLLGYRILETGGFPAWRSDFGAKFVSPRLARQHKPNARNSLP